MRGRLSSFSGTGKQSYDNHHNFTSRQSQSCRRCLCCCDLSKPSQRLQRLIHSLADSSLPGQGTKKDSQGKYGEGRRAEVNSLNERSLQDSEQEHELHLLVNLLPAHLRDHLISRQDISQLVEVVLDLGRPPYARLPSGDVRLSDGPVTQTDLNAAIALVGDFGDDNRAGIDRTLHRVSCMRNRDGAIVGLTCRVGRAITGCASLAADFAVSGKSLLVLGKPGVGKTTAIRELARLLADEHKKRVVLIDTSNEIGGDGDIPHSGVGSSRRMQVVRPDEQHRVMIEAVENHMPEVIVIDEIGTEAEAAAARTIAQRGVQLIATAHGGHLENVIKNPSLKDLVGGTESVTLGDEEARRRGTQKSVLERAAPATFDVAIELLERRKWCLYPNISKAVDDILSGQEPTVEVRQQDEDGQVHRLDCRTDSWSESAREAQAQASRLRLMKSSPTVQGSWPEGRGRSSQDLAVQPLYVYLVGIEIETAEASLAALGERGERLILTSVLQSADVVLAVRSQMRSGSWAREAAKSAAIPVYAIKSSTPVILVRALETLLGLQPANGLADPPQTMPVQYQNQVVSRGSAGNESEALEEAQEALEKVVLPTMKPIELMPRSADVVKRQIDLVEQSYGLATQTVGSGSQRRLRILPSIALSSGSRGNQ